MKVSVSLPDDDIVYLDHVAQVKGSSRSAVLHEAVLALRGPELEQEYAEAFAEWADSGEDKVWEVVVGDGLDAA